MRVSICLPVKNGEDTLAQALDSVFAQTYRDFEVIVFDDGSTDGTCQVARRYDARVIRSENIGVAAARNRMLKEVEGELVALIDHDDIWMPEKLAIEVACLDETGSVLVHTDCRYLHEDGMIELRHIGLTEEDDAFEHVLPDNKIITSSVLFRREEMLLAGGFAPTKRCSDWYGWLVLAPYGRFTYIPQRMVDYYVRPSSLANAGLSFHEAQLQLLSEYVWPEREKLFAHLSEAQRARYTHFLIRDMGVAMSSVAACMEKLGDRKGARTMHLKALQKAPDVLRVWTRACRAFLS